MGKLVVLVLTFALLGTGFSQQTREFPNPEGLKRRMEWCEQNWEQCKKMRLRMLSVEKECLEKSQSFDAFRECMFQFREEWRKDQP
ncbi:MAG: hypothetical protein GU346_06215 [Thermocrinis sp.]|jgi:hypothetical protein|nr:hypothetical protein [Thermocrinis sp.]